MANLTEASSSHIKKELWRTDLLARLQALRFPPLEVELAGSGREGVRVSWEPQGHTNYMIWFNLYVGDDPKVCTYVDPSQSGSTQGWLSTRLIKNENGLDKLPYTIEQWAVEDLRNKKGLHPSYRKSIREMLRHHVPRDLEEAWAAIRRQLGGVAHYELHGDFSAYEESLKESLANGVRLTKEEWIRLKPGMRVAWKKGGRQIEGIYEIIRPLYNEYAQNFVSKRNYDARKVEPPHAVERSESIYYGDGDWYLDAPVEHEELHTDIGTYDEALMRRLGERVIYPGTEGETETLAINELTWPEVKQVMARWQARGGEGNVYDDFRMLYFFETAKPLPFTPSRYVPEPPTPPRFGIAFSFDTGSFYEDINANDRDKTEWKWELRADSYPLDARLAFTKWSPKKTTAYSHNAQARVESGPPSDAIFEQFLDFHRRVAALFKPMEHAELHTDIGAYDESVESVREFHITELEKITDEAQKAFPYQTVVLQTGTTRTWIDVDDVELEMQFSFKSGRENAAFSVSPLYFKIRFNSVQESGGYDFSAGPPPDSLSSLFGGKPHRVPDYVFEKAERVYDYFFKALFGPVEHGELHTDVGSYDESNN